MISTLKYRLILKLVLRSTTSPLIHIGRGATLGTEVLQILKVTDSRGRRVYLVPSHSIKGVLRRVSELVAKESALGSDSNSLEYALMRAHCEIEGVGLRHICSNERDLKIIREYVSKVLRSEVEATKYIPRDSLEEVRSSFEREDLAGTKEVEPILATRCPICRLYGGPGVGGRTYVADIVINEATPHYVTRTSIERVTGKVREATLFTIETLVLPKIELNIIIEDVKPGDIEAKIIAGTLEWLSRIGISIGGMKSTGLGHYVLDVRESSGAIIHYTPEAPEELLKKLIKPLEYARQPINEVIQALRKASTP